MNGYSILLNYDTDSWDAFHDGEFDTIVEFQRWTDEWIDRETIYTNDCKNIIIETGFDPFYDNGLGLPNSWEEAARMALREMTIESEVWRDIQDYVKEMENEDRF